MRKILVLGLFSLGVASVVVAAQRGAVAHRWDMPWLPRRLSGLMPRPQCTGHHPQPTARPFMLELTVRRVRERSLLPMRRCLASLSRPNHGTLMGTLSTRTRRTSFPE